VDHTTLDDAGVFAFGRGQALVQTVDFFTPVVDDPYDYGRIAAANALSDVYAMGGRPLTALCLVCFPEAKLAPEVLGRVLRGGQDTMTEAGVSILGGHSVRDPELKFGYAVTGVVPRRRLMTNAAVRPGDRLVLTKPLGTGILTTALKQSRLSDSAGRRVTRQMAATNRAASEAALRHGVRAATDVTGFGLLGHAQQMAQASGVTLRLSPRAGWLLPGVLELAEQGIGPGGLHANREYYREHVEDDGLSEPMRWALYDPQTSGGLLLAVPPRRAAGLLAELRRRGVWARDLGAATRRGRHCVILEAGRAAGRPAAAAAE
jgi:selenide,water dikinase